MLPFTSRINRSLEEDHSENNYRTQRLYLSCITHFVIFLSAENTQNKRTGILKTQSFLDKKDKASNNDTRKQNRQNVALQTILKRNQEQEHKQVL